MPRQYMQTMEPFRERLRKAAEYAGVDYSQTAIARALGINKQTVDRWMAEGEPRPAMVFHIADSWHVSARWLATGEGDITPDPSAPGLTPQELELLRGYRKAKPRSRLSILAVAKTLWKPAAVVLFATGMVGFNKTSVAAPLTRQVSDLNTHCARWVFVVMSLITRRLSQFLSSASNSGLRDNCVA